MRLNGLIGGAILIVCAAGTAVADDDRYHHYNWKGKYKSDYFACATTHPVEFDGTIAEAAIATEALSTLVELVVAAGLVDALNGEDPLTVFAPTNEAFENIPDTVLGAIGADVDLLTAVLTYHVVPGLKDPRWTYRKIREVETLQGQTLFFNRDSGPQVNQSNVACQPVHTTNGIVYVIDSVLLPQF